MEVNVLFFGPAHALSGTASVTLTLPDGATLADARAQVAEAFPRLGSVMPHVRWAVNATFAGEQTKLQPGDELALIPPVSGGGESHEGAWFGLFREALPVAKAQTFLAGDPACGGLCLFEGATRAERDDVHGALTHLAYEAYETMAHAALAQLTHEVMRRWKAGRVVALHRIGNVACAELSVIVGVACPHRAQAFEACRYLIDTLKKEVPIWKKDCFEDGFTRYVKGAGGGDHAEPADH